MRIIDNKTLFMYKDDSFIITMGLMIVPWGGTNRSLLAGFLIVPGKVIVLKRLVEADLHTWCILVHDVDNLLLHLRVDKSLAILVAIVCAFAAKVSRETIADLRTSLARLYIFIDSGDALSHRHLLSLLIKSALTILDGVRKNARPQLIFLWNLQTNLMTKTCLRHLTITIGAKSPPIWYLIEIKHCAKILN